MRLEAEFPLSLCQASMSATLIAVALLCEDSDSDPESQSECTNTETRDLNLNVNVHEAISQTEIESTPWDTKSAISHTGSENTVVHKHGAGGAVLCAVAHAIVYI